MLIDFIDKKTANVYGIYGHLGGGKTLTAVDLSLEFLKLNWIITSNISIKVPERYKKQYTFIEDFETVDFWKLPVGAPRGDPSSFRSVIIVDEAAEFFDQYSSFAANSKRFLSWLRHSSKRGQFVFLIIQHPDFLNSNLRKLIHKWIVCDDMEQLRFPIIKCRLPFCKNFVARRLFDKYGNLLSRGFNFATKSEIGKYYDTAQSIALEGRSTPMLNITPPIKQTKFQFLFFLFFLVYLFIIFIYK